MDAACGKLRKQKTLEMVSSEIPTTCETSPFDGERRLPTPPQARAVVWYHMRRGKIVSVFDQNVLKCVVPETARWVFGSGSKNRLTPHPPDVRFHEEVVIFPLIQPAVPVSASVSRLGGPPFCQLSAVARDNPSFFVLPSRPAPGQCCSTDPQILT